MIEKMRKYSFLVFHAEYENFLKKLRELGVLHIEAEEKELSEETLLRVNKIKRIHTVVSELEVFKAESVVHNSITDGEELLEVIDQKHDAINKTTQVIAALQKEYDSMLPWGDFNPETIKAIEAAGYRVQFFVCESKNWDSELYQRANIELVNEQRGELFLMAISNEEVEKLVHPNLDEVTLVQPLSVYQNKLEAAKIELEELKESLVAISQYAPAVLRSYIKELEGELDYSNAVRSGVKQADDTVVILSGWIPVAKEEEFLSVVDKEGVAYISDNAKPEDNMPVKLKNNKFAKLFESIGELYTLPNHRELDLTPFFAPFYMLFFGFCLGDAGYGLLIVLGTLYGIMKVQPKFKPLMKLGFYLGLATTVMGIVGGTFFGIMFGVDVNGQPLQSVIWLKEYQQFVLSTDNLMVLSLGLGFVQVIFGMLLKAVNLARVMGFKYCISQLGWIVIVGVALPAYALANQGMIDAALGNSVALIAGVVGGVPALFYNSPGKNIFLNFGSGLWETYGMASGLLGDVLSYIRLFALGLSSGILGNVFNSLAIQASGGVDNAFIGAIFLILILAFGHSLNLFMALLGSFVHPLRLTFVEFYKNAGFEGGGQAYKPFSVK